MKLLGWLILLATILYFTPICLNAIIKHHEDKKIERQVKEGRYTVIEAKYYKRGWVKKEIRTWNE